MYRYCFILFEILYYHPLRTKIRTVIQEFCLEVVDTWGWGCLKYFPEGLQNSPPGSRKA